MDYFPALTLSFLSRFLLTTSELSNVAPRYEVIRGNNAFLPCSCSFDNTCPVEWQHRPVGSTSSSDIFRAGHLDIKFKNKYGISQNQVLDEYNLTIRNAEFDDSGTYTCIDKDGSGERRSTSLIVYDSEPIGASSVSLSQLKICGDEADIFTLSCNLTYKGEGRPEIRWLQVFKNGTEMETSSGTSNISLQMETSSGTSNISLQMETSSGTSNISLQRVWSQMVVIVNPDMNGTYFRCQTKLQRYNWTSSEVQIQYVLENKTEIEIQKPTRVSCQADISQSCRYNWISIDNETQVTDSATLDLSEKPPGKYVCKAECNIHDVKCTVDVMAVNYTGEGQSWTTKGISMKVLSIGLGLGLAIMIIIVGAICLVLACKRKCSEREQISEDVPLHESEENLFRAPSVENLIVRGISQMYDLVYVIFQDTDFIRVIKNLDDFEMEQDIPFSQLQDPWGLESCEQQNLLYIADRGTNNCIWKLDPLTGQGERCISGLRTPHKFSVTSAGQIVIPRWPSQIEIVESRTLDSRIIELPENMKEPYDAMFISPRTLVVAHGHEKSKEQRVCLIEQDNSGSWIIRWSFPSNGTDKIDNVDEMALDDHEILYVTDQNNQRVIRLDIEGNYLNEIKTRQLPYRLCYSRSHGKLLVGHHAAISIYERQGTGREENMVHLRTVVCKSNPIGEDFQSPKSYTNPCTEWKVDNENPIQIGEGVVSGMAELNNKLYVVLQDHSTIRVFDCNNTYMELRSIETGEDPNGLSDPWFICACPINNCLYVTDRRRECIIKVTSPERNPEIEPFKSDLGDPFRLSVNSKGRILIPIWPSGLEIYNSEGELEETIPLPEDMKEPYHAIQVEEDAFVVGHGDKKSELHRICKVKWSKKKGSNIVWSYGNKRGNDPYQLNRPRNVVINGKDEIFVIDEGNRRILQLNTNGTFLSTKDGLSTKPERLLYSPSTDKILVGGLGFIDGYRID